MNAQANGDDPVATPYRVLYAEVSDLDHWEVVRDEEDERGFWVASSADSAITKARKSDEDLKAKDLAFVAIPPRSWNPKAMEKELVERWSLQPIDEARPRQESLA